MKFWHKKNIFYAKILPLILIIWLGLIPSAVQAQINWGLRAGAQYVNMRALIGDTRVVGVNPDIQPAAYAELQTQLNAWLRLRHSLGYARKGATGNSREAIKTQLQVLEYQLAGVYYFGRKNQYFLGSGPYLSYSLQGSLSSPTETRPLLLGNQEEADMRPLDWGIHWLGGYHFSEKIRLQAHFQWGLANQSVNPFFGLRQQSFGLSLGYWIQEKQPR
jgi:Outer membrane protein beta-barrel domain